MRGDKNVRIGGGTRALRRWSARVLCGLGFATGVVAAHAEEPTGSLAEKPPAETPPAAKQRPEPAKPAEPEMPRLDSPSAEFERGSAWKTRAGGLRGSARVRALEAALVAYRAVGEHWPDEAAVVAESAFRSGELLRRLEREPEACLEFARAKRVGARSAFGARAGLELAHAARRAGDLEAARHEFESVARDERAESRHRDDGALWAARMDAELGRVDVARRAFEHLATVAESALDRIDAYDEWCATYVDAGDLEAAAGVLARCRDALRDVAEEETPLGERARNALARMSSLRRLEQAVRARQQGVMLEKHGSK
ncbi:MAG: hypothetical protein HZA52_08750 [Planctomycetes bacterium]|nr:hypothetical protein [Planctomycetota bacterium]